MTRRLFHYLCMVLLLLAQQGALVHAAWHARVQADEAFAGEHGRALQRNAHERVRTTHEVPDAQASLCAFDLAFGQVLGGVHGASAPVISAELPAVPGAYRFIPRHGSDAVPEVSRGPPAYL